MPPFRAFAATVALGALLLSAHGLAQTATAQDAAEAARFLENYSDRAVAAMNADARSDAEREAEMRRLLRGGFDMQALSGFVVGGYAESASTAQLAAFAEAFETKLVRRYAPMLAHLDGVDLEIGEAKAVAGRDDLFLVGSELAMGGDMTVPIVWRVAARDDGFRILDVTSKGISMAVTLRDEYGAVMRRGGIEGLTRRLRAANAER